MYWLIDKTPATEDEKETAPEPPKRVLATLRYINAVAQQENRAPWYLHARPDTDQPKTAPRSS